MNDTILSVENVSKEYQLGTFSASTFGGDILRWWYSIRGKEILLKKVGVNDRNVESDHEFVMALKDINFDVKRGEVLGIIGKNGAGKSTLLKLLSRVTGPTTGRIRSRGRIGSLLEVGTGFHPELTGLENIYLNGAILGMTKAEIKRKQDEIIDFSGCAQYIDTPVKRYSSGMRVRLGFAVAAFLEPEILIVDEVLAVGDFEFQKRAIGKMKDVASGDGKTVLFVSHNMDSIKNLCTTGMVLDRGCQVFSGTAEESVEYYLTNRNGSVTKKEWKLSESRPGSDTIQLERIEIHDGEHGTRFLIDTILHIDIVIDCKLKGASIGSTIRLRDANDSVLFSDGFGFADNRNSEEKRYVIQAKIPSKLLNSGGFSIDLLVSENSRYIHIGEESILSFEVEFGGEIKKMRRPMGSLYQEVEWTVKA